MGIDRGVYLVSLVCPPCPIKNWGYVMKNKVAEIKRREKRLASMRAMWHRMNAAIEKHKNNNAVLRMWRKHASTSIGIQITKL